MVRRYSWKKYVLVFLSLVGIALLIMEGVDEYAKYTERRDVNEQIDLLRSYVPNENEMSFHQHVDHIRLFIQENSSHSINSEFRSLWREPHRHYARFHLYVEGKHTMPAPMECSTRAGLMSKLLKSHGSKTRIVDVYSMQKGFLPHTFLEVQNPESLQWEITDPDINIYWYHPENFERAGIKELITNGVQSYVPCSSPDKCGWDIKHNPDTDTPIELKDENYFSMARLHDPDEGKQAYYNSRNFNIHQVFSINGEEKSFCDVWEKVCRLGLQDLYKGEL